MPRPCRAASEDKSLDATHGPSSLVLDHVIEATSDQPGAEERTPAGAGSGSPPASGRLDSAVAMPMDDPGSVTSQIRVDSIQFAASFIAQVDDET